MKNFLSYKATWAGILGLIILGGGGFGGYKLYQGYNHTTESLAEVRTELSTTKTLFQAEFDAMQKNIADLNAQNGAISDTLLSDQQRTGTVAAQVGQITSTVGALQKLSQTDPELLKKYSKVYFLNEHYVPSSLTNIDSVYLNDKTRTIQIHSSVYPHLKQLLDDAKASGLSLQIDSGYRSFGTQATLKASYRFTYGAGTANSFSAEQGYSEHQLGTAIDFTTPAIGGSLTGFEKTTEYQWLTANAYRYGFAISYPANNSYYEFEPWHWRFVGTGLAAKLHSTNMYFYDMDQRVIDTYLASIFD